MNKQWSVLVLTILVAVAMASADDVRKSMIAVIPVQTGDKDVNLMPPSELRACDWVAAWQAAREACPDAQDIRIYFKDRPGTSIKAPNLLECVDIKARGQVLIITVRKTDKTEESVILVPASEVLRLEIMKKPAS
ncbi:MAG: hypothetical protein NT011_00370 [Kiritimatiellaeota bacterium]|nr:hypothetical protein [Kiritimatiellota bacterium]